MRYHKDRIRLKPRKLFLFLIIVLIVSLIAIDIRVRPLMKKVIQYQSKNIVTSIITKSVYKELSSENYTYDKLVKISKNSEGKVTFVENNMNEINKLYANFTNSINNEFKNINKETMVISFGSLTGIDYLYGRGPDLKFKLEPVGSVQTNIASRFTSVGVNQSLHEIILEVDTRMTAVIPWYTTDVTVKTSYIIASTIVVGDIPDSYTYVTGDKRDDLSKINDYKN